MGQSPKQRMQLAPVRTMPEATCNERMRGPHARSSCRATVADQRCTPTSAAGLIDAPGTIPTCAQVLGPFKGQWCPLAVSSAAAGLPAG